MESPTEVSQAPRYDSLLLAASVALLVGAIVGFYYFADDVNALKEVPREGASDGARITRARSQIMESPSIVFSFKTGPRHLRRMGMPVYALATASKDELLKHMSGGTTKVLKSLGGLRQICIRIQVRAMRPLHDASIRRKLTPLRYSGHS